MNPTTNQKIRFKLESDDDGYPPINAEILNGERLLDGKFRLMNTPFFAKEIAYGDIVEASISEDGEYEFIRCIEISGFRSLSIILLNEALDKSLMDLLRGFKAVIEYGEFGALRMVALSLPENADYPAIKRALDIYESKGDISYAELAI